MLNLLILIFTVALCPVAAHAGGCNGTVDSGLSEGIKMSLAGRQLEALNPKANRHVRIDSKHSLVKIWPDFSNECPLRPIVLTAAELQTEGLFLVDVIENEKLAELKADQYPLGLGGDAAVVIHTSAFLGADEKPLREKIVLAFFDEMVPESCHRKNF